MLYRKKPVIIEAYQFTDENKNRVYVWACEKQMNVYPDFNNGSPVLMIPTLEGTMTASIGDYIICGVKGELYPCKPDIFTQTYEPAEVEVQ